MIIEKQIKDYKDYTVDTEGNVYSYKKGHRHKLSLYKEKTGYLTVWLCSPGYNKKFHVHRLVAEAFIPNPENKPTVNHKNSVRDCNKLNNLEWATYSENNIHAFEHGNNEIKYGEDTSSATITNTQAREIYLMLLDGSRNIDVANRFNVSQEMVANIKTRQYYKVAYEDLPIIANRKKAERFSEGTVKWICRKLEQKIPHKQILSECSSKSIKLHHIKDISRRVTYKHISKNYHW